jgi:hypothetical protein
MPEDTEGQEPEGKDATDEPDTFPRSEVEKIRKQAANYRVKLRDTESQVEELQSKVKEYEDADKSALEKLTEEKAELEKKVAERDRLVADTAIKAEVKTEAAGMGIIDPDAAFALIDPSAVGYDDGEVKGVKKALEKLIKEKPYLIEKTAPPPSPGAGGEPIGSASAKDLDSKFLDMLKGGT